MPAIRIFGRKWLFSSDDLTFPSIFEICFRIVCLIFMAIVLDRYWLILDNDIEHKNLLYDKDKITGNVSTSITERQEADLDYIFSSNISSSNNNNDTDTCSYDDILFIKTYLIGTVALISINIILLIALVNRSARGSITDTHSRRHVIPLLYLKFFLILPETALNVMGTIWAFCDTIKCRNVSDGFSSTVVEVNVIFNWAIFALIIFGLAIAYDPLGRTKFNRRNRDTNDNNETNGPNEQTFHKKVAKLWFRRIKWAFCCLRKDEFGQEAFTQVAALLSALFRGTDLVPSDVIAGCILLRVRQKRETREMRRIRMLNDDGPRYSTDLSRVFATSPPWMTLKNAHHFLRFALASYGWPMVCWVRCCQGTYQLIKKSTCCACFRSKSNFVVDDNCCLCHTAGVKYMSRLKEEDVLFASFKNQVFELPFCILADHNTKSIVISIRGSLSMRDIFTDLTAGSEPFNCPGMPEGTAAHCGMVTGCEQILKRLKDGNLLDRVMTTFSDYTLVLTGHSLGAGVSILLGGRLRPFYPDLRVFAFATPAGLLSREAARYTEQYAFTIGIGDDFVMRLSVDAVENLRTSIIETLKACKLPKYRVMLNGCGYTFFGVPSRDLEKTWYDVTDISANGQTPSEQTISTITSEASLLTHDLKSRRFSKTKLYTGGRILHIVKRKKTELEKKTQSQAEYEMRWATPEDFCEFRVMPRMLLDHFPDNIFKVLTKVLSDRKSSTGSALSVNRL